MFTKRIAIPAVLALTVGLVAASRGTDVTVSTSCTPALGTEVCTWVALEGGAVTELGATIPFALIEGVPTDVEMVWPPRELASVALPEEARQALGIDHLGINWEAYGHPPATFLTQHFDFHFYNISPAEVAAIECDDVSKPGSLPASYDLPDISVPEMGTFIGLCVPDMGMHAMPGHEVHATELFDATMMLGYYRGEPIFFEPMVSRELLLAKSDFELAVPAVTGLPAGVRYPRRLEAKYDAASQAYRLVFTGFDAE